MEKLSKKVYAKEFVSTFPGDESGELTPRQTPGVLYSKAIPTAVRNPKLLAWSEDLAQELGIERPGNDNDVAVVAGNLVTPSMYPYAACYAGHQFGQWAGQLGDGRAITLGEWKAPNGKSWEIQLKGAGLTAYSRRADGRAVLRSSVREYLMSEAMFYLGVPTTRALSLVSTGENVMRDMFYDGNPQMEPGAIVTRVSPSFLRFGNYEILAARNEVENLKNLVEFTIAKYFPHLSHLAGEEKIIQWYREVVQSTAHLMTEWIRVGFVHGVMNTDNMSVLGLTIDYGPYSFVDDYDKNFTPNTTDLPGRRYAFGRQAAIAHWNLGCFAGAIAPLFQDTERLSAELDAYTDLFIEKYHQMMAAKLGLDKLRAADKGLINEFEKALSTIKPDMTIFYQKLTELHAAPEAIDNPHDHFLESFYRQLEGAETDMLNSLVADYISRIKENQADRSVTLSIMRRSNPRVILRNYLLHEAIEKLQEGDGSLFERLQEAMKEPYSHKFDEFFKRRPDWATQRAGCSMLSCSS